jgi:thiol-disulfide isomerase/thioredoxin
MRRLKTQWKRLPAALLATCVSCAAVVSIAADERRPLPAFTLVSPSGDSVVSSQLSTEARPLLIYVGPECPACDRLIAALIEWQPSLPANRIVVIISAAPDRARAYAEEQQIAATAGIKWYADPLQGGATALGVQHVPALVALENGRIDWIVSGVLNAPSALESIVRSWTSR